MSKEFNTIQIKRPNGNNFNLSHDVKFSHQMGKLTPTFISEVIPGDKFNIKTETLIRVAPLLAPVMHNVNAYMHYFFVPNRILWKNWEKFITGNQGKPDVPAAPYFTIGNGTGVENSDLADYLGLPIVPSSSTQSIDVNALPFAAYRKIYDDYYRDQNLIDPFVDQGEYILGDGDNTEIYDELNVVQKRAWEHDYFTSNLPWAQKGEAVSIPLSGDAPVMYNRELGVGAEVKWTGLMPDASNSEVYAGIQPTDAVTPLNLYADLTQVTATTINQLREAIKTQEWLEKMARGGSRYIEQILAHFGVRSSDARLQRPEFIGGTKAPVIFSEVLSTFKIEDAPGVENDAAPLGTMGGHGISASRGKSFHYRAEEHGFIIGILSIMPKTAYQQGVHRMFNRTHFLDYAWPTFAHLGEQEVLNKEVFFNGTTTPAEANETFGYVPRYAEYRTINSRVAGEFRDTLAFWHFGRIFATQPALNQTFIECTPRLDPFAVELQENDVLWCHSFHSVNCYRLLPKYGTPTL